MPCKPLVKFALIFGILLNTTQIEAQYSIALSEYMPINLNSRANLDLQFAPWIELQNIKNIDMQLERYSLLFVSKNNTKLVQLPEFNLFAGGVVTVWIANSSELFIPITSELQILVDQFTGTEDVYIVDNQSFEKVDSIILPTSLEDGMVAGKSAFGQDKTHIYSIDFATFETSTTYLANFQNISPKAGFPPADSDPNACVSFKGKLWIFGGWNLDSATGNFGSKSYIWNSNDGTKWTLINTNIPFSHYSSFIAFNDTMWVYTNFTIFSSTDGINWDNRGETPYPFFGERCIMKVVGEKIYYIGGNKSGFSLDGINFTFSENTVPERFWGSLQYIGEQLFFFGGQNIETEIYYNDCWTSTDGLNWQIVTPTAEWPARKWFMSDSFLGCIWVFGGYNANNLNEGKTANMNDIWYSKNGIDWLPYSPLHSFGIRHASYHTQKDDKFWIFGGFDNYEKHGFYNDVWTFEPKSLFLKDGAFPSLSESWTYAPLGKGPSPKNLDSIENSNFYISGHVTNFPIPQKLTGKNNQLFIGNGFDSASSTFTNEFLSNLPIYVSPGSSIIFRNISSFPEFTTLKNSSLVFDDCQNLKMPYRGYWNLGIKHSKIGFFPNISVRGNLLMEDLNLPKLQNGVNIELFGNLSIGNFPVGLRDVKILGANKNDQIISTIYPDKIVEIDKLILQKPSGNFILNGQIKILESLKVEN